LLDLFYKSEEVFYAYTDREVRHLIGN